jgi:hypothetical protein
VWAKARTIFLCVAVSAALAALAWSVLTLKNDGVKLASVQEEADGSYPTDRPRRPPKIGFPTHLPPPPRPAAGVLVPVSITSPAVITAGVSVLALIVTAIGATSTILLGWRAERRQADEYKLKSDEYKLKIQQLELQLAEAKATAGAKHLDTAV